MVIDFRYRDTIQIFKGFPNISSIPWIQICSLGLLTNFKNLFKKKISHLRMSPGIDKHSITTVSFLNSIFLLLDIDEYYREHD